MDEDGRNADDAEPMVVRKCGRCGQDRILEPRSPSAQDAVRCGCGVNPLDDADIEALEGRGP